MKLMYMCFFADLDFTYVMGTGTQHVHLVRQETYGFGSNGVAIDVTF